ncbi:hypothetical protein DM39_989 [Burkholderia cenocepacia]|uniref:Uncharacterized protein n=1 Tax=Burkholderia cenocepacia TaxID=95486 RepID=A0AAN0RPJ5_9BURK|nr:hypothetical protein DM39_989 [Burkholderia cenocepacia]
MRPPAKAEVIDDVNGELTDLYRVVPHRPEEFVRQFKRARTGRYWNTEIDVWNVKAVLPPGLPAAFSTIQAASALHSLAHARHDSRHALQGSCLSACFVHSCAQSLHASIATFARPGR